MFLQATTIDTRGMAVWFSQCRNFLPEAQVQVPLADLRAVPSNGDEPWTEDGAEKDCRVFNREWAGGDHVRGLGFDDNDGTGWDFVGYFEYRFESLPELSEGVSSVSSEVKITLQALHWAPVWAVALAGSMRSSLHQLSRGEDQYERFKQGLDGTMTALLRKCLYRVQFDTRCTKEEVVAADAMLEACTPF
jgi:hypothetical protein